MDEDSRPALARSISLSPLRGFLAAAQTASFTEAANRLHLTQSALSRQVQSLEADLGMPLFVRTTRQVTLTEAGRRLQGVVARALREIDDTVAALRHEQSPRIAVSTFSSAASLWLIPRLYAFAAMYPDVEVSCMASDRPVDMQAEQVDLAIRSARLPPGGGQVGFMFEEVLVPVASPSFLARQPLKTLADLAQVTLLGFERRVEEAFPWVGWPHWLQAQGIPDLTPRNTLRFTNHDQVIQAALAGQGVALARASLLSEMLRDGALQPLFGLVQVSSAAYYLVTSEAAAGRQEVRAFADWVLAEAAQTRRILGELGFVDA